MSSSTSSFYFTCPNGKTEPLQRFFPDSFFYILIIADSMMTHMRFCITEQKLMIPCYFIHQNCVSSKLPLECQSQNYWKLGLQEINGLSDN